MASPDRREFLALLAVGGATMTVVGGVLATDGDDDPGDDGEPASDLAGSIETDDAHCADPDPDVATASYGDGAVTVDGRIQAPTPCHEAVLTAVEFDGVTLTVSVSVESSLADDESCIECVGDIGYEATVQVDTSPATVVINHDDRETFTVDLT